MPPNYSVLFLFILQANAFSNPVDTHIYKIKNNITMKKETKIIAGVLAGAALGAAIALILASDKNEEMKDKVSNWFCDLIDASKDRIADVTDQVKDTISKVRA
jgi:glycerol uptake facilitator-like aquaporin